MDSQNKRNLPFTPHPLFTRRQAIDYQLATGVRSYSPNCAARLGSLATPWVLSSPVQDSVLPYAGCAVFMPDPINHSSNHFLHRRDPYGVYHSVCLTCYQPVAKDSRELRLINGEEQHECEGPPRHQYPKSAIEQTRGEGLPGGKSPK